MPDIDLPAHASPFFQPTPLPSSRRALSEFNLNDPPLLDGNPDDTSNNISNAGDNNNNNNNNGPPQTPELPGILSPSFTPPSTPGGSGGGGSGSTCGINSRGEPKSIPVIHEQPNPASTATAPPTKPGHHYHHPSSVVGVATTATATATAKQPRLLTRLPHVECIVRARIPTVSGAEMFLHLYQNDADDKEHLAIVFGNRIRSRSLDAVRPGESEMDRMIRGAYVGRLHPGRTSSRIDRYHHQHDRLQRHRQNNPHPLRNSLSATTTPGEGEKGRTKEEEEEEKQMMEQEGEGEEDNDDEEEEKEEGKEKQKPKQTELKKEQEQEQEEKEKAAPLVRIHSECYTGETAWSARCDCGEQLDEAARLMSLPNSTGGVIVYLRQEGRGIGLGEKLKAYNLQDLGSDTVEANLLLRHPADARSYGLATAMLQDLGLGGEGGVRLLTNNPDKVRAVEGPNQEVIVKERVPMIPLAWKTGGKRGIHSEEIEGYLRTKIGKMGHMLS